MGIETLGGLDRTKVGWPPKAVNPGDGYTSVKWSYLRTSAQETTSGKFEWEGTERVSNRCKSQGGKWRKELTHKDTRDQQDRSHPNNREGGWRPLALVTEGTKTLASEECLGS